MRLWLLEQWPATPGGHTLYAEYDCAYGFVVRAETVAQARVLASTKAGDEGAACWLNPGLSSCVELKPEGEPGIVLRDFLAG